MHTGAAVFGRNKRFPSGQRRNGKGVVGSDTWPIFAVIVPMAPLHGTLIRIMETPTHTENKFRPLTKPFRAQMMVSYARWCARYVCVVFGTVQEPIYVHDPLSTTTVGKAQLIFVERQCLNGRASSSRAQA